MEVATGTGTKAAFATGPDDQRQVATGTAGAQQSARHADRSAGPNSALGCGGDSDRSLGLAEVPTHEVATAGDTVRDDALSRQGRGDRTAVELSVTQISLWASKRVF